MNPLVTEYSLIDASRKRTGLLVGLAGILINGVIFAMEFFSGMSTGSTTLTADAFHNLIDAVSAVVTVISFLIAGKPADRQHPFGFGRVEYLSSLLVGMVIAGIGLFFARSSFEKALHPSHLQFSTVPFILMIITIPLKLIFSLLNRKYAKKAMSQTMAAAALDALGDVFVLTVAAFSLIFARLTGITADGPLGLVVSGFILFSGYSVIKRAVESLIGKAPDPAIAEKISSVVSRAKFVTGIHDLVVHDYGPEKVIASIHAEMPSNVSLTKANQAVSEAEQEMKKQGVELVVHIDPV